MYPQHELFPSSSTIDLIFNKIRSNGFSLLACAESMGKIPFLLSIAIHSIDKFANKVGFVSLNISNEPMIKYQTQNILSIPYDKISFDHLEAGQKSRLQEITENKFQVTYTPAIELHELLELCNSMKHDQQVEFIIIDGIENILENVRFENKRDICRSLRTHTRALNIPILITSNLPHPNNNMNSFPTLDLLNSDGNYCIYADQIIFLYRPEYYGIDNVSYKPLK